MQIKKIFPVVILYPIATFTLALIAGFVAVLASASVAEATVIGFDLNIEATTDAAGFGTGVTTGNTFTGMMFFDTDDPNYPAGGSGLWLRTVHGSDMLTIAGLDFSQFLNNIFWGFLFLDAKPLCITSQNDCSLPFSGAINIVPLGFTLAFFDANTGAVIDDGDDRFEFSYTFTSKVPEPGTLAIFGFGLLGLGLARRRRKTA